MRVLGFSKKWPKLYQPEFTTFRFPRKDSDRGRDWKVGELVQIVYHPRGKDREVICVAKIISKTPRKLEDVNDTEACLDGFESAKDMHYWMLKTYGGYEAFIVPMSKLTLKREVRL